MEYKENLALKEGKAHIKLTLKMKEKKQQNKRRKRQQRKTNSGFKVRPHSIDFVRLLS